MNLEQMKYIVEIANSGSITSAAERLHISQPSISQSVANLEKELNIKIFKRSRSGTQITEHGAIVVEKAKEILKNINDINNIFLNQKTEVTGGLLSFTFIASLGVTILPKVLSIFKGKYPKVRIQMSETGSVRAVQQVLEGKVDLALIGHPNVSDITEQKLSFIPLMRSQLLACVGSQSLYSSKSEISVKQIIEHPICVFNEKYSVHNFLISFLKNYGEPNILFASENSEVSKNAIAENLAIGFYTDIFLKTDPYFQNGLIYPLKIKELETFYFHVGIIHKQDVHLPLSAQKFIEELQIQASYFKKKYGIVDPD